MNSAILLRAHKDDRQLRWAVSKLKTLPNFYVLFDATDKDKLVIPGVNVLNFTIADYLHSPYPLPTNEAIDKLPPAPPPESNSRKIYYNPEYALLFFWERIGKIRGFNNYYSIEYDVAYTGDWSEYLKKLEKDDSDLLSTFIRQYPEGSVFQSFWNMINCRVPDEKKFAMFGPFVRYSAKLMQVLHDYYCEQILGYYEVIVPTLAAMGGCTIRDVNAVLPSYLPVTFGGESVRKYWTSKLLNHSKNLLFHPVRD